MQVSRKPPPISHSRSLQRPGEPRATLRRAPGRIACVFFEPERTVPPEPGFLAAAAEVCRREGALLVFDELITGFRWHNGGAQAVYGVTPDLSTFGKGWRTASRCRRSPDDVSSCAWEASTTTGSGCSSSRRRTGPRRTGSRRRRRRWRFTRMKTSSERCTRRVAGCGGRRAGSSFRRGRRGVPSRRSRQQPCVRDAQR